jgi:tRNA (guanine37-N1)-methyltransferase
MRITCLSLFPEITRQALAVSIPGKAQERGLVCLEHVNLRDFANDKHHTTDEIPYGGGAGMVFKIEPAVAALRALSTQGSWVIHPSPAGQPFDQKLARQLAGKEHLIFLASRYEGLDQRVIDHWVHQEISLGDYVLSGGELACAVMIDAIMRLIPGVVGKRISIEQESFEDGLLEHPQYTRPALFEELAVPEILLSGHHEEIRKWRKRQRLRRTLQRRPDLLQKAPLDGEAQAMLREMTRQTHDRSGS